MDFPMSPRTLLLIGICAGVVACNGDTTSTTTPAAVAAVSVSVSGGGSSTLLVGQSVQLVATAKDAQGNALTGRTTTWSSSAATIASVNAAQVNALAAGSA